MSATKHAIWVLGATGRSGKTVAPYLVKETDITTVLVGRDQGRIDAVASTLSSGTKTLIANGPQAVADAIREQKPAAVLNTLGDYASTATLIARACMSVNAHYVDLAADLIAVQKILDLHNEAVQAGSTLVPSAGFGILGTEAAVAKILELDDRTPKAVRIDGIPSIAMEGGKVGAALAHSLLDAMSMGGRKMQNGQLVSAPLGEYVTLTTPDGDKVTCGAAGNADLLGAYRVSKAPSVTMTSSFGPAGVIAKVFMTVVTTVLALPFFKTAFASVLAMVPVPQAPMPYKHTWGHAVATYDDGSEKEVWLKADDAQTFTSSAMAQVGLALVRGEAKPGAYTPAEAFGPKIAERAGAEFIVGSGRTE